MNFQQLEYFLSLCQNMNYSETARRLYVSQPTVSKQIAALESELNMKLFKRSSNGLALTAEGQIMQNAFEHAIHIINAAKEDALHLSVQKSRTIHFGILEGADIVSPIMGSLAELEKQIENTNFSFDFLNHGTLNHKLEYNEIDLAVTLLEEVLAKLKELGIYVSYNPDYKYMTYSANPMIEYIPLRDLTHGLVAHRSLLKSYSRNPISDLCQNCNFYITSNGSRGYKKYVRDLCQELNLNESCFHIVPDIETQILNVESGMGISAVSLTPRIENNPSLLFFPLEGFSITIVAAWHKNNTNEGRRQLIRMIRKHRKENNGVF